VRAWPPTLGLRHCPDSYGRLQSRRIRELSDRRRFEVSSRGVSFTVPRNIEISWIVDTIKKLQEEIFEISKKGR